MISNNKLISIVTELFIRDIKLNIWLVFITKSCLKVPKDFRLNSAHYFLVKLPNKESLNFGEFAKIYKQCTEEPYCFLLKDVTLQLNNPLHFR